MTDILFETVRAIITGIIFLYLSIQGWRQNLRRQHGWVLIQFGFGLLLIGSLFDITDNFPELNRFIIIGQTGYEAFLEKIVGYTMGFLLLAVGFWKWLPTVIALGKAQTALQESEERYRTLFENAAVSIFLHDCENGALVAANRKALEDYGCVSLEELQSKDYWLEEP
ncbi:MAG: PAS domain S-box protein, partial [Nitrospirota bacterium]|nr:PAS domain S-box protein [Nitrospirota bacterium]